MNLPSLYARVVAKRPELAVPFLEHCPDDDPNDKCPWIGEDNDLLTESTAAALILARWVEALPVGHHLSHDANERGDVTWCVYVLQSDGVRFIDGPHLDTPLEALAAFYLEETK